MRWRQKAPELAVASTVLVLFLSACCSIVVRKVGVGWFNMFNVPVNGFFCVLVGWGDYPFGWLANPLLGTGIVLLCCGRSRAAFRCGMVAIVPVVQWSLDWRWHGQWRMISTGYYLWVASVVMLVAGAFAVQAMRLRRQSRLSALAE